MYIVLDTFNAPMRAPMLCTDKNGETLVFDTYDEAKDFGNKTCQDHEVIIVGRPAVYIAVEGGQVREVLGNTPVSVEVMDFDRPIYETDADRKHFAEKEAEWETLKKDGHFSLY
jgi:hypothetical protein